MASQKRRGSERISSQGEARERGRCLKIRLWDRNAARLSLSLWRIRSQLRLARSVADDHKSLPSASRVKLPLQSYRSCRASPPPPPPRPSCFSRVARLGFEDRVGGEEFERSCDHPSIMRDRESLVYRPGDIRAGKSIISSA